MVEDSQSDAALIDRELSKQGYSAVCTRVETAQDIQAALERQTWDLIISDYILPNFSGLDTLKMLRERTGHSCIITSGTDEELLWQL
jgi:DNA-binding response OmpR family regulator